MDAGSVVIEVRDNGPYRITGPVVIRDQDGNEVPAPGGVVKLCRCGASATRPFCDGEHSRIGFAAAERALEQEARGDG